MYLRSSQDGSNCKMKRILLWIIQQAIYSKQLISFYNFLLPTTTLTGNIHKGHIKADVHQRSVLTVEKDFFNRIKYSS